MNNYFKVYVKSEAKNNRANEELIDILAKYFKVEPKQIVIIRGTKSKNKTIGIYQ